MKRGGEMTSSAVAEEEVGGPSREAMKAARVLSSPMRVRILNRLNGPSRTVSPKTFAEEIGENLGSVSYHFRVLEKCEWIALVDEHQRRGATEHVYAATRLASAWGTEWASMPPAVKQTFAASALRGAVERVAESIDSGCFTDDPNSHLTWRTEWVDAEAWKRIHTIWLAAYEEASAVCVEARERLEEEEFEDARLVTFFASTFESPGEVDAERPPLPIP
jgi:DNA-binding transcriptional ArsR family regulator